MSQGRIDIFLIIGSILAGAGIFLAASQGLLPVSGKITDGVLILLSIIILHRAWRLYRRRSRLRA
jgi:sulfite exporter TauE/SafE